MVSVRRRSLLAMLVALSWPAGAVAAEQIAVLFVGNSFTRQHDVAGRVAALAADQGVALAPVTVAIDGTTLEAKWTDPGLRARMTERAWDAVVLQDYSTIALTPEQAARSAETVGEMTRALAPARPVLFETWARAPGHGLYAREAAPEGPMAMQEAVAAHYERLARETGGVVAPVGRRFTARAVAGDALFARDGHHASADGAALAARVLWQALARALGRTAGGAANP